MTVLVGYRPMPSEARCPSCDESHGMIETTDKPGVYRYGCWCGAHCTLTASNDELLAIGVPEGRLL